MIRKTAFFEELSWFKFNNLGLALDTTLKCYTSLSKGSKLKVRKFWRLIPTFVEVTEEKLLEGIFAPQSRIWLNLRLKSYIIRYIRIYIRTIIKFGYIRKFCFLKYNYFLRGFFFLFYEFGLRCALGSSILEKNESQKNETKLLVPR